MGHSFPETDVCVTQCERFEKKNGLNATESRSSIMSGNFFQNFDGMERKKNLDSNATHTPSK